MSYTEFCNYCGKEYVPKRRGVQQFCSNSCRSRNWQINQKKKQHLLVKNEQETSKMAKISQSNKLTAAGIGNAAIGTAAVDLTKHLLTPEHKRNATKEDIRKLSSLMKGQRYFPVNNLPNDTFGKRPFYDIETGNIIHKHSL
ncbi:hypothetical protein EVU94_13775 [Flavobacteriaceae bacterium 144Ye]|nr:hypothetical protein EVU94_13775 [Flavobacteriaceae bacterium 144Ye]